MSKSFYVVFIILLGLFFLDSTVVDAVETPSEKRYIQALQNAMLYDFRIQDEPYAMAELIQGAQMEITSYAHEMYYEVPWGKNFLYVAKKDVQLVSKRLYKNVTLKTKETPMSFIPKLATSYIFESPNEKAPIFAKLKDTYRYPIIERKGEWFVTSIGGRKGYIPTSHVKIDKGVPILVYHHILKQEELGVYENVSTTVTDHQFLEQVKYLAQEQFKTITMPELVSYLQGERTLPVKSVALTFDDGLLSTKVYAYPVLKAHQLQASQYMISSRTETAPQQQIFNPFRLQSLSFDDLEKMKDVFTYEAHTYDLHNWIDNESKLVGVSKKELATDLTKNLSQLPTATSFSYPFGRYTDDTLAVVKQLGFQSAVTTKIGYNVPGDDVFQLKRQGPSQQTTMADFKKMVIPYD